MDWTAVELLSKHSLQDVRFVNSGHPEGSHDWQACRIWIDELVIVHVCALASGLAAWKSGTISASLPAHGAVNTLGPVFGRLAAYYIK